MFPNVPWDPVRDPLMQLALVPFAALVIAALVGSCGRRPVPAAGAARPTPHAPAFDAAFRRVPHRPVRRRRAHWRRRKNVS